MDLEKMYEKRKQKMDEINKIYEDLKTKIRLIFEANEDEIINKSPIIFNTIHTYYIADESRMLTRLPLFEDFIKEKGIDPNENIMFTLIKETCKDMNAGQKKVRLIPKIEEIDYINGVRVTFDFTLINNKT